MYPISGIFKYGDSDSSILLQSSLTSAASITDVSGTLLSGTAETFDSTLGMLPGAAGGAKWLNLTNHALLETSGQLSVEVQNPWVGTADADAYSSGYDASSDEYLVQVKPTSGTQGRAYKLASNDKFSSALNTGDSAILREVSANDRGDFALVTMSWTYGTLEIYIDGVLLSDLRARTVHQANQFQNIIIGNNIGATVGLPNHYVRNLIVSTQPVRRLAVHPLLRKVALFGDSFTSTRVPYPFSTWGSPGWDCEFGYKMDEYLRRYGIAVGEYDVQTNSGNTIIDDAVLGLENGGGRATMLANNPTLVVMQAGINDLSLSSGWSESAFTTDLQDHIDTILGTAGVKKLVLMNTISNYGNTSKHTATAQSRWVTQNTVMATMPAVWDAANPSDAGRVIFHDVASEFGGITLNDNYSIGQISGGFDNVHPSPVGGSVMGRAWAKGVLKALS